MEERLILIYLRWGLSGSPSILLRAGGGPPPPATHQLDKGPKFFSGIQSQNGSESLAFLLVIGLVRFLLRFFFRQFFPSLFFVLLETVDSRCLVEDQDHWGEKHPKDVEVGNK
jgi:hypothetical protein